MTARKIRKRVFKVDSRPPPSEHCTGLSQKGNLVYSGTKEREVCVGRQGGIEVIWTL